METADRLNFDEFDLLCRAADSTAPLPSAQLFQAMQGENLPARGKIALQRLIARGFIESTAEDLYQISAAGTKALS